jgi:hypothetical protein
MYILQWILTKLGTYLVPKRIWNPIDFQGQMSRSPGQICRRGDAPRFALPLLQSVHKDVTEGRTDGRKEALLYPFATSLARG